VVDVCLIVVLDRFCSSDCSCEGNRKLFRFFRHKAACLPDRLCIMDQRGIRNSQRYAWSAGDESGSYVGLGDSVMGDFNEKLPEIYEIIVAFLGVAVGSLGAWFSVTLVRYLGFSFEQDFIGSTWRMISLLFIMASVPLSIIVEMIWDQWKNKGLSTIRVVISAMLFFESMLVISLTGLFFEVLFPGLSFTHEPFPGLTGLALGLMIGLPMLVVLFTFNIPIVRGYMRKVYG